MVGKERNATMRELTTTGVLTGRMLRKHRERAGKTVRKAAKELGITPGFLSAAENGYARLGPEVLRKLVDVYGITVEEEIEMFFAHGKLPPDVAALIVRSPRVFADVVAYTRYIQHHATNEDIRREELHFASKITANIEAH